MELSDLLAVGHHPVKEEWRSVTTTSGALSVMTHGAIWMPVLLACTLAIAMKVITPRTCARGKVIGRVVVVVVVVVIVVVVVVHKKLPDLGI